MSESSSGDLPPTVSHALGAGSKSGSERTLPPLPASNTRPAPVFGTAAAASSPAVSGYEVLGELGRGGMGVVYKARDLKLNRLVALKMILAGGHAAASEVLRFKSEAEAIARLQHPNIVQIYHIGMHAGLPYFSLEFVEGGSLDKKLNHQPRAAKQSAQIVETLARAVQAAHERGIIHRDLKPGNVLVGNGWVLKITDFGLARKIDEAVQTQSGNVMGTPSYMAPEQAAGQSHAIGPAVDVYALGAILYELLTGRPPFKAATTLDTLLQVMGSEPLSPRQLEPKTPLDLETVCLKCLQKAPAKRYASAADLAEDLRRFQAGEPILARPVSPWERGWRWAKRRPKEAGLLAALAFVVVVSLWSLFSLWRRAEAARADAVTQEGVATTAKVEVENKNAALAIERDNVTKARDQSEARRLGERRHLYAAHLNLMQIAWRDRLLDYLEELLDKQAPQDGDPDLRGFEFYYARRLLEGSRRTLSGHADKVTAVAFSADRGLLVAGAKDGAVKVWELATGLEVRSLVGHTAAVAAVAFSPNARLLATAGLDGRAIIWETATGKKLVALDGRTGSPGSVAFSPDSKLLAAASNLQVTLHDAETGKEVGRFTGHTKAATAVTFSPDGRHAASAGADGTLCIWETASGKELFRRTGLKVPVTKLAFMGFGQRVVLSTLEGALLVWDPEADESHVVFGGNGAPVAWRGDVRQVAILNPVHTVRVCDATMNRELFNLRGHTGPVVSMAYSADGTHLATAGADRTVKVWAVVGEMEILDFTSHRGVVNGLAYSPDGKRLATASADGTLRVREAATGQEVLLLRPHKNAYRHAVIDQTHTLAGVSAVAYSPDGTMLATGGADTSISIRNAVTGALIRTLTGHQDAVTGVAFSRDGRLLASSSWDRTVRVWDLATGKQQHTLTGHTRQVTRVAFSPDGKLLASSSWDETVKLWDTATGTEVGSLNAFVGGAGPAPLDSVAFHPDGKYLIAANNPYAGGGEVKLFDLKTREVVRTFRGHAYGIYQAVFSKDGRRLATATCKGNVKVWDTDTGQEVISYQNRTPRGPNEDSIDQLRTDAAHGVAFSPDGQRLAIACRNSKVIVLDATPPTPELLIQREAYQLVNALYDRLGSKSAVLDHLRGKNNLSTPLCQEAQLRAERYLVNPGAGR
jgi:WD40 repeat protein/tRNA A-37 threonylcarbamoyl transferase component Bud32